MIVWRDLSFCAEETNVNYEILATDVLEGHGDGVLFVLDPAMEGFLGVGGCVRGGGAVECEGEGGIDFVLVGLFARQRVAGRAREVKTQSYPCIGFQRR